MNSPVIFAGYFAQLVSLLMRRPELVDEQKASLRALVVASKEGMVHLSSAGSALLANGEAVPPQPAVIDLLGQMTFHGLLMIAVDQSAPPAHVLGVARILAAAAAMGDGGAAVEAQRVAIGATSIRFAARPRTSQDVQPPAVTAEIAAVRQAPPPPPPRPSQMLEMEFGDVLEDPYAEAMKRVTPRSTQVVPVAPKGRETGFFAQFSAPRSPTGSVDALLTELDSTTDVAAVAEVLDDLAVHAEQAAKERKSLVVSRIMTRIASREAQTDDFNTKRACTMTLRRLAKPELLKCVTMQLAADPDACGEYLAILSRAGEDGADALIEQIGQQAQQRDRRVYFDALLQLKSGVTSLLHMLSDPRWFAVRNAAEILGELQVKEAEVPLTELLRHDDERVRRAANAALMRMGTARAMQAIQAGLADPAPDIRSDAAAALVTRKDPRSTATLIQALDSERDEQVQASFLLALGKMGTAEAVQRLAKSAEAERGLFKRKTPSFRIAAVHGLSEARTPEALAQLQQLQNDKEAEVRDAARFALGRISKAVAASSVNEP